jgi:cell division initiation protein
MRVTSLEIRQQAFAVRFRGYDPTEVDTFLELVAGQVEDLAKENAKLRQALVRQEENSHRAREGEDDWKKALMAAQQIREDLIGRGQQQAQITLAEAEFKAQQLLMEAKKHVAVSRHDVQALNHQRRQLADQLRHLLEQHLALLDAQHEGSEERRCDDEPRSLLHASEASNGSGEVERSAGDRRDPVNKGVGLNLDGVRQRLANEGALLERQQYASNRYHGAYRIHLAHSHRDGALSDRYA